MAQIESRFIAYGDPWYQASSTHNGSCLGTDALKNQNGRPGATAIDNCVGYANGAFNIARKGLMIIDQIKASDDLSKLKFDISNKSWLNFAQQKPYKHE